MEAMNIIFNLLIIAWLCVFIIDMSGIIDEVQARLRKVCPLYTLGKPFTCSLCMTWWVSLAYLLIVGKFTLPYIAVAALLAVMTTEIYSFMDFVKTSISYAIERAEKRNKDELVPMPPIQFKTVAEAPRKPTNA